MLDCLLPDEQYVINFSSKILLLHHLGAKSIKKCMCILTIWKCICLIGRNVVGDKLHDVNAMYAYKSL